MTARRSKYDLAMAENYARLAFQSASPNQDKAQTTVTDIMRRYSRAAIEDRRLRIAALADALQEAIR